MHGGVFKDESEPKQLAGSRTKIAAGTGSTAGVGRTRAAKSAPDKLEHGGSTAGKHGWKDRVRCATSKHLAIAGSSGRVESGADVAVREDGARANRPLQKWRIRMGMGAGWGRGGGWVESWSSGVR